MNFAIRTPRAVRPSRIPLAAALLGTALAALAAAPVEADARPHLKRIGSFSSPTFITAAPGDSRRLFITERAGTIRVERRGRTLRRPFLRIPNVSTDGERGLLSMAFSPRYQQNRRFYVFYTAPDGDIRIDEFKRSRTRPNRAVASSRRAVLEIEHSRFSNHNGGQLQFGPDGMLYIATGDGGGSNDPDQNAQNRSSLLGKLLRIDPRPARSGRGYRVPAGNPFAGSTPGRGEIYHYGLRNPYRFSFDRVTGDLAIGDVGQSRVEEVDFRLDSQPGGANFGWDCFEGTLVHEGGNGCLRGGPHVEPVLQYRHGGSRCSITGGYVGRHRSLGRLRGRYLYADLCTGRVRVATLRAGGAAGDGPTRLRVGTPVSFGEGPRGQLYIVSLEGAIFRILG